MSRDEKEACERAYEIGRDVPLEMSRGDVRDNDDVVSRGRKTTRATETLDLPCRHSISETTRSLSRTVVSAPVIASEVLIKMLKVRETLRIKRVEGKRDFTFTNIDSTVYCRSGV